jgi:outer membrane receptor protein involved in Fe transport
MRRALLASLLVASALPVLVLAVQAQEPEGATHYPAAYFQENQPATAYDMVQLLPGFRLQSGDSGIRGFSGTVGNVLIDGQLPTSKEESVDQVLQRISASTVERIELIRGAADMHGYAILANVVRIRSASLKGRAEAEGTITHFGTTGNRLALNLTRQAAQSVLDVSASYGRSINNMYGFGARGRFLPDGTPVRLAAYDYPALTNHAELSANYRRPLWGGNLGIGGVLKQQREYSNVSERIYFPAAAQTAGLESDRARNGEARAEYQHPLGDLGQLQLFAVHRQEEQDEISQTMSAVSTDRSRSRYNQREDVGRLAWQMQDGALKLESGVEGTINVLNSHSTLTLNGVPVALPAANLRVEEDRAELFATGTWRFSPVLVTELGTRYETSVLKQSGDSSLTKDLSFLKPRFLTTWDPMPGHQLRFLAERQVGQLNFRNFASSTSLNSNVVNAGNKNLEPDRSWILSLTWERHFWDRAALVLEARQEHVSHVVDHVPVFSGTQVFDAVGNIGNGRRDTIQGNLILPLDAVGMDGVTVKADATLLDSRVRDPATGVIRPISGDQPFGTHVDVTYDLPEHNLRLGGNFHDHAQTKQAEYRIDEISSSFHQVKLGAFIEHKPAPAWTVRLYGNELAQTASFRDRQIYGGQRGAAPLTLIERRSLNNGAMFGLRIQHEFL